MYCEYTLRHLRDRVDADAARKSWQRSRLAALEPVAVVAAVLALPETLLAGPVVSADP